MQCLYCGTPLAILRMLANGTFCCDEHRDLYERKEIGKLHEGAVAIGRPASRRWLGNTFSIDLPDRFSTNAWTFPPFITAPNDASRYSPPPAPLAKIKARTATARRDSAPPQPKPPRPPRMLPATVTRSAANSWPPLAGEGPLPLATVWPRHSNKASVKVALTPAATTSQPLIPKLTISPSGLKKVMKAPRPLTTQDEPIRTAARSPIDLSSQRLREIWHNAPGDLKTVALVIPMVLLLTLNAAGPKLYTRPVAIKAASQPMLEGMLTQQWHAIRKTIARRAGFGYADDFRSGLDAWTAVSGSEMKWSYDNMGFVRPGALALLRPTLPLADYQVEFTGRLEQKAIGFAFRAADGANYQAVKLVLEKLGPLPEVHVVRYTVLNGREGPRSDKSLPMRLAGDAFYTVHLDVRGNDFTLMIQEKMADFWSDDRLKTGGIGFFCGKGEVACLRRVEVSYQNDTLGRFCAFIAPEPEDSNNGS